MKAKIKNICFITDGYPSDDRVVNAFVETLVNEITDEGINCYVISPQSVTKSLKAGRKLQRYCRIRKTKKGGTVRVYTPKYISVSSKKIGPFNTAKLTLHNFRNAALRTYRKLSKEIKFDAVYGHFIFCSGITANYIGKKFGVPSFLAYGENTTYTIDYLGDDKTRELLNGISGVIAVSTKNKRVLVDKNIVPEDVVKVFPNSYDPNDFYIRDRIESRKQLGLNEDAFIISFVGRFVEIKGALRVSDAIDMLDEPCGSLFIGSGPQKPKCRGILFEGPVAHDKLGKYLSASDVFVLPTEAEGCCNAIIEAIACGLPVISSDRDFNADILDASCACLIEPDDVNELANALTTLMHDSSLRERMSAAAIEKSKAFVINKRAHGIIDFMESQIN